MTDEVENAGSDQGAQTTATMAPPPQPPAPPATGEQPWERGRGRRGGLFAGLLLIVIGVILLLQQYFPALGFDRLWPVIIIVIGIGIILRRR